jgi:hypothetical protein
MFSMSLYSKNSPDGRYRIEFLMKSEVGMGGPAMGDISVNGHYLGTGFLDSWCWSVNSDKLLLISPMGRNPDKSASYLYDVHTRELYECEEVFGYSIAPGNFDGNVLIYDNPAWGKCRLTPKTRIL